MRRKRKIFLKGLPVKTISLNLASMFAASLHTNSPLFWIVMLLNVKVLMLSLPTTEAEIFPKVCPLSATHVIDEVLVQLILKLVPSAFDTSLMAGCRLGVPSEKENQNESLKVPISTFTRVGLGYRVKL
jgi:hypothetical protein